MLLTLMVLSLTYCNAKQTPTSSVVGAYANPIAEQRADPWIYKDNNRYYFIATAPSFDRIEIKSADTINGIKTASAKVVWKKHNSGPMSYHIWAPELHKIDDVWYIYFASGMAEDIWHIRMYALSNPSADPTQGQWTEEGQIKTHLDTFSLDATTFSHRGQRYLVWAQENSPKTYNTAILMAKMSSPTTIEMPISTLSIPELPWETIGYKVNEGPSVLIKHGRVFITYSASATDHNYAMGLLWADIDANLMDPTSWKKSQQAVFSTNETFNRFGPGHSNFTLAEDGKTDVLVYHARNYRELKGSPLEDPNRHTRVRVIEWSEDKFPLFGQQRDD